MALLAQEPSCPWSSAAGQYPFLRRSTFAASAWGTCFKDATCLSGVLSVYLRPWACTLLLCSFSLSCWKSSIGCLMLSICLQAQIFCHKKVSLCLFLGTPTLACDHDWLWRVPRKGI